jgi:translation elongation factor EF-Tu-like GTPase
LIWFEKNNDQSQQSVSIKSELITATDHWDTNPFKDEDISLLLPLADRFDLTGTDH